MSDVVAVSVALVISVVVSEFALRGVKVQSALTRVILVFGVAASGTMVASAETGTRIFGILMVFWAGAFLTWFGVRSHLESSILLRFLMLLEAEPLAPAELLSRYEGHYGTQSRLHELHRGGLIEIDANESRVTRKGRKVLMMVKWLR